MQKLVVRGTAIGLWGLVVGYLTTFNAWLPWAIALFVTCWAVYYALRPISVRTGAVQLATIWIGGTLFYAAEPTGMIGSTTISAAAGASLLYGTWFFVSWMTPVALMAYFAADWQSRKETQARLRAERDRSAH